jgi:formylglycine-generating enzyme required for sulfatase activity
MKISLPVLLAALAAGLLLLAAPHAEWRWQGFAQVTDVKRKRPTPTPVPRPTSPNPAPRKSKTPPPKSGGASATPRRAAPEIEMVYVPGGSFLMGSPENETGRDSDEGQHRVTVQSFYIGKYEVTQSQWRAVMGSNPSYFKGDNLPVENVSWNDAKDFCRRLSQMTGKEYRLPTEAEWEYACRAKTTGAYAGDLDAMAWYSKNSDSKTHSVGQKQPNAFGLYDMHGNVWEWCEDWYGSYPGGEVVDPMGPRSGSLRVDRGGGWGDGAVVCRSANRGNVAPGSRDGYLGFRLLRTYR